MLIVLKRIWNEKRWYSWTWFSLLILLGVVGRIIDIVLWQSTVQQNLILSLILLGFGTWAYIDWYKKNDIKMIKWGLLILTLLLISNIIYFVIKR